MQRDVKVGLVLGVLLVAVVAAVFFRRDDEDRDKFAKLLPAPDAVANKARGMLGSSPSDPYPVAPEYLRDAWESPAPAKPVRTPTPTRANQPEASSQAADDAPAGASDTKKTGGGGVVLHPPEYGPPRQTARMKSDAGTSPTKTAAPDASIRSGAHEYTIREGDTLSDIADRLLGNAALYPLLYEANGNVLTDPNRLPVGQKIRIPELHKTDGRPTMTAQAQGGRSRKAATGDRYEVQENDTLSQIAREVYGDGSMWRAIFEANRDQLTTPDNVPAGVVLRLP